MSTVELDRINSARLAELVAFNREVSALIRSGMPLEVGLGAGELDSLSARIGDHLRGGLTLPEAIDRESRFIPATYRALIEAGLGSGNLPAALDGMTRTAGTIATLRRRIALAAIYPSILVLSAVLLTIFLISHLARLIQQQFLDMHESPPRFIQFLIWLVAENPLGWIYWLPALALLVLWGMGGTRFLTLRMPGVGPALRYYRLSVFADLASSLMRNKVPLDQALSLAAAAAGDRRLTRETQALATRLQAGESTTTALRALASPPPFARWMIGAGAAQDSLAATLEHLARWARRRGDRNSAWFTTIAPISLTLLLGGFTLIVFATLSFGPVISLLKHLGREGAI